MAFKRRKSTRYRGYKSHGRGFKKKARGSGHRGGFGKSGSENQKKTMFLNLYGNNYFGSDKALRKPIRKKLKVINLDDIQRNFSSSKEIDLTGYKILGDGHVKSKLIIKAHSASKSAIEKIKKAGGSLTLKHPSKEPEDEE